MLGNQLNKICFVFRCGQRTGYTRFSQRVARFFIFTLLVSTSFLLSIFLRTSVGSFIPPLSSCARFSSNPGSSIFENEFSPIHVGKIVIGHTALVEGRLLARWVYWETLGIYYAEWFQWRWWNQVWKWRNCGVESKSESRIFKRIMSFHYTFAWLLNYYNVGRKFESILVYLSREKKISRSIPSKTRRILLKIVFPQSTI